jgi:hypothetical protein
MVVEHIAIRKCKCTFGALVCTETMTTSASFSDTGVFETIIITTGSGVHLRQWQKCKGAK